MILINIFVVCNYMSLVTRHLSFIKKINRQSDKKKRRGG